MKVALDSTGNVSEFVTKDERGELWVKYGLLAVVGKGRISGSSEHGSFIIYYVRYQGSEHSQFHFHHGSQTLIYQ